MNLKFALIAGAGIIFAFIAIFIGVFSAIKGPEKVLSDEGFRRDTILQKKSPIPRFLLQQKSQQEELPPIAETPQSSKKTEGSEQQIKKITPTSAKNTVTPPAKETKVPPKEKKGVIPSKTTSLPAPLSEKEALETLAKILSPATSTPQILIPLPATTTASSTQSQETFEKLWPKQYLQKLRLLEDNMIKEGFKDANDRNNFATNEDVLRFIDSMAIHLFAKKLLTANDVMDLRNIIATLSATINLSASSTSPAPELEFELPQEIIIPTE